MIFAIKPRRAALMLVFLGLLALGIVSTRATSVLPPTFERLVASADLIFTGQVLSQHSEWREIRGQKSIVTLVTFGVHAVHKGRADSTVTLQFLGGSADGITLSVTEMPTFNSNERVLLFVQGNGVNASPLVGFYHGKFSIRSDTSGRETVFRNDGQPLVNVKDIASSNRSPNGSARALSHDEFTGRVRELVNHTNQH